MRPVAFYAAAAIIAVFLPAVGWTYAALHGGFLCHQPTTLAGIFAAIYAGRLADDFGATAALSSRARARAMHAAGHSYGYGWFVGKDGRNHVGIDREPLW